MKEQLIHWEKYTLTRKFTENGRVYVCPDNVYRPGVTTVLGETAPTQTKIALAKWRANNGKESKKILNRGNKVHEFIEQTLDLSIESKPLDDTELDPEIASRCKLIKEFLERVNNVKLIEGAVWSPWGFAGTVDCVGELDGELSIIDWKTATKPKREEWIEDYKLQVAAYCAGVNRVYNTRINLGAVVVISNEIQVFKLGKGQMKLYWDKFRDRLAKYHRR